MSHFKQLRFFLPLWLALSLVFTLIQAAEFANKPILSLWVANSFHYALWLLTLPVLGVLVKRFPLQRETVYPNLLVLIGACVLVTVAVSALYIFPVYIVLNGPLRWPKLTQKSAMIAVQKDLLTCVLIFASLHASRWWQAFQSEQVRASKLESRLAAAKLSALRMQLQPHFLFNTLHSIAGLILEDPKTANHMVVALGDFLRLTLEDEAVAIRSLRDELEFVQLYAGIEKLRLGDRVRVEYQIEPDAANARVPYLILQPLLENAIRHGVARVAGPATISVRACHVNGDLRLTVENDGPPKSARAKLGVGITNTIDRLRLHYRDRFKFELNNRGESGCIAELTIPYRLLDNEDLFYASEG